MMTDPKECPITATWPHEVVVFTNPEDLTNPTNPAPHPSNQGCAQRKVSTEWPWKNGLGRSSNHTEASLNALSKAWFFAIFLSSSSCILSLHWSSCNEARSESLMAFRYRHYTSPGTP